MALLAKKRLAVKLLNAAKEGYSVGIAADGPRGPSHEAKAGLAFLAYKAGIEIVPFGVAYSSKFQFQKAWDKYQLPKPFSKVIFYLGEPLNMPNIDNINEANTMVAQAINAAELKANLILEILSLGQFCLSHGCSNFSANNNR